MNDGSRQARLTRRRLLRGAVRLGAGAATLALIGPSVARQTVAVAGDRAEVRVADFVEAAAAFNRGQRIGVEVDPAGLRSRAGGEYVSGVLALPFAATHLGLHWRLTAASPAALRVGVRLSRDGTIWSGWRVRTVCGWSGPIASD